MTEIERLARALIEASPNPPHPQVAEHVVLAILQAMREPSEGMVQAGWSAFETLPIVPQRIWTAVIDALLEERE